MINEFIEKQITVPLHRYEQLVEDALKYNQMFESLYRTDKKNNKEILQFIDNEKYIELLENEKNKNESEEN